MAPTKRTSAQADVSEPKKARVADPIMEKVEAITRTLSDPECQVPGAESHREMLLASLQHTLTVPCDERHEYQTAMAQMVDKVMHAWVADWETKVSNAQAKVDLAEQQSGEGMKSLEESASRIDVQEQEVARCQEVLRVDSEAVTTAQEALEVAAKEVADFDSNLQETIDQKDHYSSVYNECFILLKSDSADRKEAPRVLKRMEPVLKKLGTESSLLSAVAPALKKSPEERGPFDTMAIDGIEAVFTKHLGTLQEQIEKADVLKAEKVASQGAAQEALDVATGKQTASETVLKEAEEVQRVMEVKHGDILQGANSSSTVAMEAMAHHGISEEGLVKARQVLGTFTELLERQTIVEPVADAVMSKVEDTLEPMCVPSPMKSIVAA